MPTQIRTIPPPHNTPESEHDKYAYHHREALRLALGSILAPKRTFTPSSSGTSSPAHPWHFPNAASSSTPPSPPQPTPVHGPSHGHWDTHGNWDAHLHPHSHPHAHHPSRLGMSRTNSSDSVTSSSSTTGSPVSGSPPIAPSPMPSEQLPPSAEAPAITISSPNHAIHAPIPVQPAAPAPIRPGSPVSTSAHLPLDRPPDHFAGNGYNGHGTPKGKWIDKLGTKSSAWDALIHGSFS